VIARQDTLRYRAGKFAQRHKLGLAATAMVILSLVGGIVIATYQAQRAERRFQQVRRLANTFLFDIHDKIQNLSGSTEAREMLVKTALEYLDSLALEAAGDSSLEWELATAYEKVGDVQGAPRGPNLGHTEAAIESYQKAVNLTQELAARDEADSKVLQTLAGCYFKLGDLQAEIGDKPAGVETMRKGLNLAESLAQRSPDPKQQALVENLYVRLGDVQLDTGDASGALESYRHSQEMTERRAREHPSDDAQLGVALDHSHVGEALGAMGDITGAIASYSEAARIVEELVKKEPSNPVYRANQRVVYNWLGNLFGSPHYINRGDRATALLYFRRGLAIAESLAAEDPKNAAGQLNLATNYGLVADLVSDTNPVQAAEYYRKAIYITKELLETAPGELRLLRKQALFLRGLAGLQRISGDHREALRHLRQSLQALQDWSAAHSTNFLVEADLHATLNGIAAVLLDTGDLAGAGEHCRLALATADADVAAHPMDARAIWRLADSYTSFGRLHAALASRPALAPTEKVEAWREALSWHQKAFDVWDGWSRHSLSTAFNITKRDAAARAIARCDAVLSGSGPGPEPQ
jgi:eukaryotic-like serine/threonine-protein kinase